jgi:nicotinamide-nucleotide amidase
MNVSILSIGDELLIGQVVNTNASWMAELLNSIGFDIIEIRNIADKKEDLIRNLNQAREISDLILVTGGLGPTADDRTKEIIAEYFNTELVLHPPTLDHVRDFFTKIGKKITHSNELQAFVPKSCKVIPNKKGTAPGMHFEVNEKHFFFMPGVPGEMKHLMKDYVVPHFSNDNNIRKMYQKTVLTHGLGESFLADKIKKWEESLAENISLAYLPSPGRVRLRLRADGENKDDLKNQLDSEIKKLEEIIPDIIYGYDNDSMEGVVGKLLMQNSKSICTAESCTGGLIASKLTDVAGSSAYFKGSIIAYSNQAKMELLGVSEESLEKYGAVSEEVVIQMAKVARKKFNADFAISTSGIAGPDGGTTEKPVGTVWIGFASENKSFAIKKQYSQERERNKLWTYRGALNILRLELLKNN